MPGIIRAGQLKARIVRAEVWDARQQAQQILDAAKTGAVAIKAAAVAEGRADGYAEVAQLLLKAHRTFDSALAAAEQDLIRLAVTSAERIVHEELKLDPGHIRAIVTEALQRVRQAKQLRVFVHPEDKLLLQSSQSVGEPLVLLDQVSLLEDAELSRGSCVVSSEWGEIDARIETRLDLIREALQK
jgi:flagellar assembly protein FliH